MPPVLNILLTGSSTGIGRMLAVHLLGQGHRVWGIARSDQSDFATSHPESFRHSRADASDWDQMLAACEQVRREWHHLDALITCAGVQGEIGRTVTTDPARWSATVRANLDGTYHAVRAGHSLLQGAARRAKIVCFSGGGATKPRPNFSAYGVAKTGVVRLVETIAEEERGQPLDINAIAPGAINTRLTDEVIALGAAVVGEAEYQAALKQKQTGGASLERAVGLVDWLLSPRSDGVTGRLISAPWDSWQEDKFRHLATGDVYTLRRIVPEDRKQNPAS